MWKMCTGNPVKRLNIITKLNSKFHIIYYVLKMFNRAVVFWILQFTQQHREEKPQIQEQILQMELLYRQAESWYLRNLCRFLRAVVSFYSLLILGKGKNLLNKTARPKLTYALMCKQLKIKSLTYLRQIEVSRDGYGKFRTWYQNPRK